MTSTISATAAISKIEVGTKPSDQLKSIDSQFGLAPPGVGCSA